MPQIPDLTDPRYLDDIGWFLYHEKYRRGQMHGSSYLPRRLRSYAGSTSRIGGKWPNPERR
jgi:hypothetical protein